MEERKQRILHAVIRSYIETAEPVGSRTIARVYDLGVSSATIRNEMQDLELMGYLEQPHTSAGRVPTQKGYRFYVDSIGSPEQINEEEATIIREWADSVTGLESKIFDDATKILSTLTHNLSLAVQNTQSDYFNYIRFLPLDYQRAILLLVTKSGMVDNSIFIIPQGASYDDLQSFANRINNVFHGVPLSEITDARIRELQKEIGVRPEIYFGTFEKIRDVMDEGKEVFADGVSELIRQPEFQDMARIKELISLVEKSAKIAEALHSELTSEVHVRIGPENNLPSLHDYSVVQAQFFSKDKLLGTVAVIGPTRMEYDKVISVLQFMQNRINRLIQSG